MRLLFFKPVFEGTFIRANKLVGDGEGQSELVLRLWLPSSRAPPSLLVLFSYIPDKQRYTDLCGIILRPSDCYRSDMASEGARLRRLFAWFDPESVAVLTILLGLFQVLFSAPFAYIDQSLPKLFILPLVLGIVVMAGGSLTMANEKNPSRLLLQGCVCSNVVGLLGTLLAFGLYYYTLHTSPREVTCSDDYYSSVCLPQLLADYSWSVTLLLLLFDTGAVVMHCLLSISAFKTLKTN
ncbi:uncharacterized protein si:dkey-9i23.16 isoform X1 [Simochromis diagramma]|uniref:uncharacterized protein si:dkey-9i23.16 isoform X1 n=1 Tax=Simochromis diagramma TaxID=43689 RepID=UPI001A7E4C70|nr:uncharacterized protein si:dkey-9i23.16 isoform X1 [Simochromis diagramma]